MDKTLNKKKSNENTENVGSSESQISIFSKRIKNLTEHLKSNKKIITPEEV